MRLHTTATVEQTRLELAMFDSGAAATLSRFSYSNRLPFKGHVFLGSRTSTVCQRQYLSPFR